MTDVEKIPGGLQDGSGAYTGVVKNIARNTSVMLLQYSLTWGTSFLAMIFIPRYLGPVEYGRLFLATSVISLFRVFIEYGGSYLVAKEVARNPRNSGQILVDAVAFRLVFAMAAFGGVLLTAETGGYPSETNTLLLIFGVGLFGHALYTVLFAVFQGHEKMKYTALSAVVNGFFGNVLSVVAVILWHQAWIIAVIGVSASLIEIGLMVFFARRITVSFPRIRWEGARRQLKAGLPYFMFAIFSALYARIDAVMLSKMTSDVVVGWFGGARKLFEALALFPFIFSTAVYPVLSRLWKQQGDVHRRATQKSLEFMVLLGVPLSIGVCAFARLPIQIFFGLEAYGPTVPVLQILSPGIVFLFIDMVLGTALLASDRQRAQSILALVMIPLNVGMNFIFIPYFHDMYGNGGMGAAVATVLTEVMIMMVMIKLVPRGVLEGFRMSVVYKSLAAGGAMAGGIVLLLWLEVPTVVSAALSVVIFHQMLFLLRTFEPEEERALKSLLTPKGLLAAVRSLREGKKPPGEGDS